MQPQIRIVAFAFILLAGCSATRKVNRYMESQLGDQLEAQQFTGLLMVDAQTGDTLFARNHKRYFTPASNIKLFTLYAALRNLPDHIPALRYGRSGDSLYVVGTGDPSALHPDLADSTALRFLQSIPRVVMVNENLEDNPFGPGWAWDDFDQYYTPQRTAFPFGGNILRMISGPDGTRYQPLLFRDSVRVRESEFARDPVRNQFYREPRPGDTLDIPIQTNPGLERQLWATASGSAIKAGSLPPGLELTNLPGMNRDSVCKLMMTRSDNFIAEQLMLAVSSQLGDTLAFARARDHVLENQLADLPQPPRWVDGSGLSRYNLVTPESIVHLLGQLYAQYPEDRLFALLAQGGRDGTLKDLYHDPDGPYLFGKTGSLSNNHNLSGYLRTRSGRLVIFSYMNNHYTVPTREVRERMQRILVGVRESY